jgi:MtN3 and saliva related transmembrane protein
MDITPIIGNIAAALTTISFLPQAIKTIKTKDTGGLSFPMYFLFVTGVSLWLVYGMLNDQMPIIIGNLVTLVLAGIIFGFMLKDVLKKKSKKPIGVFRLKRT